MKNVLVVISGPSGVGKGTIVNKLIERNENLKLSVSCTTRAPRSNEVNGEDYYFIDERDFFYRINNGMFLEYSQHFDHYYGTPLDFVNKSLKKNDILLEIDVNGGANAKKKIKDAVLIFIMPPSLDELKKRLISRGTESQEEIDERLERIDYEMEKATSYDYVVVNDNLDKAIEEIEDIINDEKNK